MAGTQGIFTNNMYIGDNKSYLVFYTDTTDIDSSTGKPKRKLRLVADEFIMSADDSDLGELIQKSVHESVVEYCLSASTVTNTHGTVWMNIMPSPTENNPYLWQRTKVTYNDGTIKFIPDDGVIGDGFYVETATGGTPGEDAITLTIQSSNGETFRSNSDSTVLSVVIFKGLSEITSQQQLDQIFGQGQVSLRWTWKNSGDNNFTLVPNELLGNNGFTCTINGSMVTLSKIFQCELIYNEGE